MTVWRPGMAGPAGGLALGVLGTLLCVLGLVVEPHRMGAAWLASLTFWIALPLGCLAMLLLHALAGGGWRDDIRRELLAGLATLPLLSLAVLPILIGARSLYGWAQPQAPAINAYLTLPFFMGRTLFYLVLWNVLGLLAGLRIGGGRELGTVPAALSLLLLTLSTTFAVIDWLMSLEAPWTSSAFGLLVSIGWLLGALAMTIGARTLAMPPGSPLPDRRMRDLANLLLAAVLGVAYVSFMQFLIIWEENLSHEVVWFLHRSTLLWLVVTVIVVLARTALPFVLLLFRRVKQSRAGLLAICGLLVLGHLAASWWLVIPSFGYRSLSWTDFAALLAIGGLVAAVALRVLAEPRPRAPASAASLSHG